MFVQIVCDNCGAKARKAPRQVENFVRHFCNRECYMEFKRKNPNVYTVKEKETASLRKIKRLAEMRRNMYIDVIK